MNKDNGDTKHILKNENNKVLLDEQKNIKVIEKEKDKELSKSIKQNKNKILINSKSTDELKPKNFINIENNKYKDKERYSNIEKEQINKINFHIKNQNIKLFVNEKNNDEKNLNIDKLKKNIFNMTNHLKLMTNNNINQKEFSPLCKSLEQNNLDKRKLSKKIYHKKIYQ
jgi:hypothetical protein